MIWTNWKKEHLLKSRGLELVLLVKILRTWVAQPGWGEDQGSLRSAASPVSCPVAEIVEAVLYLKSMKQNWQLQTS